MEQYIKKSALIAEIENLKNTYKKCQTRNSYEDGLKEGRLIGYKDALHKINTLEVKEVEEEPVSIWHDPSKETPIQGSNILMIRREEGSDFPPIAGCFHGTNSRSDGRNWGYYNGFCYNEIEPPLKWAYVDDILNLSNVGRIGKEWKEEPVSEPIDFEKELYKAFGQVKDFTLGMRIAKRFYDMGKNSHEPVSEELEQAAVEAFKEIVDDGRNSFLEIFKAGAEWAERKNQKK